MELNNDQFKSKTSIRGVNILYLMSMVLFVTVGAFVQSKSFSVGILITEFLLIAMPTLIYLIFKKGSLKRELRFNRLHIIDAILVVMIFVCGYPVALFINLIGNIFVSMFGKLIASPIPMAGNINEYFLLILIVAGSAGLCEEILFRGLILRGYEGLGMWKSIIFTAALFAMLHMNIQNILGPLLLGIILGYVVYTTNSIYAGMLGHFVNNAISVTITFFLMQLPIFKNAAAQNLTQGTETLGLFVWAIILGFAAVIPGVIVVLCMMALKELNRGKLELQRENNTEFEKQRLRNIIKNPRVSWPIYVSVVLFSFYSVIELAYVVTGRSILDIIF